MPDSRRLPLWAGRTAALLGIVLVAFTLRQAVAAVSPILGDVRADIPISNIGVGLLGTLPPSCSDCPGSSRRASPAPLVSTAASS